MNKRQYHTVRSAGYGQLPFSYLVLCPDKRSTVQFDLPFMSPKQSRWCLRGRPPFLPYPSVPGGRDHPLFPAARLSFLFDIVPSTASLPQDEAVGLLVMKEPRSCRWMLI